MTQPTQAYYSLADKNGEEVTVVRYATKFGFQFTVRGILAKGYSQGVWNVYPSDSNIASASFHEKSVVKVSADLVTAGTIEIA
jgi:hypothetical protein